MRDMNTRSCALAIATLAGLFVPLPACAAEQSRDGTLTFIFENDIFSSTDRHYTNGVRLAWAPNEVSAPGWVLRIARLFPWFPVEGNVRHGYALGQNVYTPHDIELDDPPLDDRPYAGWLYGTIGLGIATERHIDQFALTLGVVGPASRAEQSQKFIHELTDGDEPRGWNTQLGNEPGIVLTYQRGWRGLAGEAPAGSDLDLTPYVGGALGNIFAYANAGLTVRYGKHLPPDYGPPRIQPGLLGSSFFTPRDDFGWYVFAGFEGRAVARNIFLDGNTFHDSRGVDKEPLVGDFQLGMVFAWRTVRLSYAHVLRTHEFEAQRGMDSFGAFALSMRF